MGGTVTANLGGLCRVHGPIRAFAIVLRNSLVRRILPDRRKQGERDAPRGRGLFLPALPPRPTKTSLRWVTQFRVWTQRVVGLAALAVAGLGAWVGLCGLMDFDLSEHRLSVHRFEVAGIRLEGTLALPDQSTQPPIVVLVHGDGPQDRWSDDAYLPLVNALLDGGIGVFSWDKPGIGSSTGSWLQQSMHDRALEAAAALEYLRSVPELSLGAIGYLGFSQAGWVLPEASQASAPAFGILVGAAVNWRRQGAYYTRRRLQLSGLDEPQVAEQVRVEFARNDDIFGNSDRPSPSRPLDMSPERFRFVQRNHHADATEALALLEKPLLAVWGKDDLNVDPTENPRIYTETLPPDKGHQVLVLDGATHGLLRSGWFNYQLAEEWPWAARGLFVFLGRSAFVPEAIPLLTRWIHRFNS